ncbi:phosphoadenylyl-sulfate reductase [Corynebacterium yudongzhengii]|uniref:Adenosine 5'-phosphosulfate reductase n=1 Tax=Corynebacterium yudongzhengii TaxID=2080740 RepID=A0A2U1T892_9CORY|nr:phosphoadenylyl-sulfate reductase [Corynebacterium yudongzhengii]AWB82738.1 phosphoadenylyl-sulfate reductase [Corynebacterium yudongzhengii]PWC02202.1 phosphoadenylyl-sulfate reductase [Corynebacterium yudongzhengii]
MTTSINLLGGSGGGNYRDPEISPEGQTTADPLSEEILAKNREFVDTYADELYDAEAKKILDTVREHAPGPLVITMSMENTVLAELSERYLPGTDLLFLDTEYHFPETLEVADAVEKRYPNNRLIRATATLSRSEQDRVYGRDLYRSNPTACCRMRKVEPLQRNLSPYAGMIDGLRRADGPTRAHAPAVSINKTGRLKVSPMITWTLEDTDEFIDSEGLILHPLTRQGYPSIGCATCTMPVAEGEDPRAGRWAGSAKTECGLHTE